MTRAELCQELGVDYSMGSVLSRLNKSTPLLPKRVYIKEWVHQDSTSSYLMPRAVYARGDLRDAKKPKPMSDKEKRDRWRQKERFRVNSVFQFAAPRRERHRQRREGETPCPLNAPPETTST